MNTWGPILLGAFGAVISAFGAWTIARRQRSGRISTTEAETLWAESQAMRRELRDETVILRKEVQTLRAEAVALREESVLMRAEMVLLREEGVQLRAETAAMRRELAQLRPRQAEEGSA